MPGNKKKKFNSQIVDGQGTVGVDGCGVWGGVSWTDFFKF